MLTSTTRDGGYRTSSYPLRRRRRRGLIVGGGRRRGTSPADRAWSRLATTTAPTLLGVIGTSLAALLRQTVRP